MSAVIEKKVFTVKEDEYHSVYSDEAYELCELFEKRKLSSFDAIGLLTSALALQIVYEASSRVDFEPGGDVSKEEWLHHMKLVLEEIRSGVVQDLERKVPQACECGLSEHIYA